MLLIVSLSSSFAWILSEARDSRKYKMQINDQSNLDQFDVSSSSSIECSSVVSING